MIAPSSGTSPGPRSSAPGRLLILTASGRLTLAISAAGPVGNQPNAFGLISASAAGSDGVVFVPALGLAFSLIPGLVDESIRWVTPVKHFMRTATADTELHGLRIAKGDWLMLCYGSANRDEAVFPDADRFRIDRKPNRHVAFGSGIHRCVGVALARMEIKVAAREVWDSILPHCQEAGFAWDAEAIGVALAVGLGLSLAVTGINSAARWLAKRAAERARSQSTSSTSVAPGFRGRSRPLSSR